MNYYDINWRRITTEQSKAMNAAKERKRMASPPPDYPAELPYMPYQLILLNWEFELAVTQVDFIRPSRGRRIDSFMMEIDGIRHPQPMGLVRGIRYFAEQIPRARAPY